MFFSDYSPYSDGYVIRMKEEIYQKIGKINGSFVLLPARLLGWSYVGYLTYLKKKYNVKFNLKGNYKTVIFINEKECKDFCEKLNIEYLKLYK